MNFKTKLMFTSRACASDFIRNAKSKKELIPVIILIGIMAVGSFLG